MNKNIEYERRVMLTKNQYKSLIDYALLYKDRRELVLINHYFDDEDLSLRTNHKMLRIRNINENEYELTLKIKGENGDTEINESIKKESVDELIKHFEIDNEEINEYLGSSPHKEIKYITSLRTERIEIKFKDYLFVLDRNMYSDIVDYNLEIEANNLEVATKTIKKYCDTFGMQYSKEYQSKSRRAINRALNI